MTLKCFAHGSYCISLLPTRNCYATPLVWNILQLFCEVYLSIPFTHRSPGSLRLPLEDFLDKLRNINYKMEQKYVVMVGKTPYEVSWLKTSWKIARPDDSVHIYPANVASSTQMPAVGARIFIPSTRDAGSGAKPAWNNYSIGSQDYGDELRFVHGRIVNWESRRCHLGTMGQTSRILRTHDIEDIGILKPAEIVVGDDVRELERTSFWYALPPKRTKMKRLVRGWMDKVVFTGGYFPFLAFYYF